VLREVAGRAWRETIAAEMEGAIRFKLAEWRGLPLALQRATLRAAIHRLCPSLRNINFVHIENAVEQLQAAHTGARVTLPQGLMMSIGYDTFTIASTSHVPDLSDMPLLQPQARLSIPLPGVTLLPDSDWRLEATYLDRWGDDLFANPDRWTAYLDADATGSDLSIRARRTGDFFHPQGMPVSTRLTDWMTNVKIPRDARDGLPLIIAGDRIAWVAGFRIGQPFIVTSNTRRVLRFSFHR
jgi:tRNA(Ile)-lysidine synthase